MRNRLHHLSKYLVIIAMSIFLFACSKVSQENFDKVKPNMTMKEVIAILGEPTRSESVNVAGISGTSAIWKQGNAEIDIQFLNDRVAVKSFSKDEENNKTEKDNS